ncbi:MAG: hypothetical protein ISS56_10990 [Anaerolineae bacterium]|nr:hypothetical protein [Anaerolineae bacterium]
MIAPFTLHDLPLLKRLAKVHVALCPIEALTRPSSPLWTALLSLWSLDEARLSTFVLNEQGRDGRSMHGFAQVKQPSSRPEMYIQYMSPRLDADEDARAAWTRLLSHVAAAAGERGVQRIYACAPDGTEEMEILLGAGFSVYCREEIFRLVPGAHPQAVAQAGIRPEQSTDAWAISQLYRATAPHLVQQAESLAESDTIKWLCGPVAWNQGEGFVLEDQAGIAGYGFLMPGRTGHWLRFLVHSRAGDGGTVLLDHSLALLNYYPTHPVYCAVREYQGRLRAPLAERGFDLVSVQCRLVKHTTARIKEPARSLVPALEKRAEAPTTTVSPTEGP